MAGPDPASDLDERGGLRGRPPVEDPVGGRDDGVASLGQIGPGRMAERRALRLQGKGGSRPDRRQIEEDLAVLDRDGETLEISVIATDDLSGVRGVDGWVVSPNAAARIHFNLRPNQGAP